VVVESGEAVEHRREHGVVEPGVDAGRLFEKGRLVIGAQQRVNVGEVTLFGPVEQCDQLPAGKLVSRVGRFVKCWAASAAPRAKQQSLTG
jgi:hypothetical protein